MLLGQARGKVGDIVFSRSNGQQIVRARTAQVKNPQTEAQILQRILLNTVSQAYSKMYAICDHSFEGVNVGQDTMSTFMSRNLNALRSRVASYKSQYGSLAGIYSFAPIGARILTINPFIMSTGQLTPINVSDFDLNDPANGVALLNVPGTTDSLTYEDVINAFGLQRGDQITFCQMSYDEEQGVMFSYARVILDPVDENLNGLPLSTALLADGEINMPSERNQGTFARLTFADGTLSFSVGGATPVGACIIVSRQKSDGTWMRSNATMKIVANPQEFGQYGLLEAISLFYTGGIDFESAYYLNNAESNPSQSTDNTVQSAPYLNSLYLEGTAALSNSAATIQKNSAALEVVAGVSNYDAENPCSVILSSRNVSVGSTMAAQAGDLEVACTGASTTGNVTLVQGTTYTSYFVVGGIVKSIHRKVEWPAESGGGIPGSGEGGEG